MAQQNTVSKTSPADPFLKQLHTDAEQVLKDFERLFGQLSDEQLAWKPTSDTWSVAECLEHLTISTETYRPGITDAVQKARRESTASAKPYRAGFLKRMFLNAAGPNGKRKVKTSNVFTPSRSDIGRDALERFRESQQWLIGVIEKADGCNLNGFKTESPVTSLLKLTLGEALELQVVHQQRHLEQARNLLTTSGFPGK